jgi:hypothetical protein
LAAAAFSASVFLAASIWALVGFGGFVGFGVAGGFEIAKSAVKTEKPIESAKSAPTDLRDLFALPKTIFLLPPGKLYVPRVKGLPEK